jgi:hypothetical protein
MAPPTALLHKSLDPAGDQLLSDAIHIYQAGYDLEEYLLARQSATHAEVVDARHTGLPIGLYAHIRNLGATHAELLDVQHRNLSLAGYFWGRLAAGL